MSAIIITPMSAVAETVLRRKPSHLLTLIDPATDVPTPASIPRERHLRLGVNDITEATEGRIAPTSEDVARILAFAADWNCQAPFLVHCWAGVSRSTAAAYIVLCQLHGPGHEETIARLLRARAPHAQPNALMVRHGDTLLSREGRMIAALRAMGPARIVWEADVVELPLILEKL